MAMFKCPDCNKNVSDKAEMCPHCGHKFTQEEIQKLIKSQGKIKFFAFLFVILIVGYFAFSGCGDSPSSSDGDKATTAAQTEDNSKYAGKYEVLSVKNADVAGYTRRAVKMAIPLGMSKEELTEVMEYAANKIKKQEGVDRVWIHAYQNQTENYNGLPSANIDIDDKGNADGKVDFLMGYYFMDPEKYVVSKLPEEKRKEYYSNALLTEYSHDFGEERDKALEALRKKYGISKDEAHNISMEANIKGWRGPNVEKYADHGYYVPKEEVSKEWYQCGTLHNGSSEDWLHASHQNRLATCADFLFKFNEDGKLNLDLPPKSDMPALLSELKEYAAQLAIAVDEVVRSSKENLNIPQVAVIIMTQAGWIN